MRKPTNFIEEFIFNIIDVVVAIVRAPFDIMLAALGF